MCEQPKGGFYVECSGGSSGRCGGWVHPNCVGLTRAAASNASFFTCKWCKAERKAAAAQEAAQIAAERNAASAAHAQQTHSPSSQLKMEQMLQENQELKQIRQILQTENVELCEKVSALEGKLQGGSLLHHFTATLNYNPSLRPLHRFTAICGYAC